MATTAYLTTSLSNNTPIYMPWCDATGSQTLDINLNVSLLFRASYNLSAGDYVEHTLANGNVIKIRVTDAPQAFVPMEFLVLNSSGSVIYSYGYSARFSDPYAGVFLMVYADLTTRTSYAKFEVKGSTSFEGAQGVPSDNKPTQAYVRDGQRLTFSDGSTALYNAIYSATSTDPYEQGGGSSSYGGGTGTFSGTSTAVDIPGLPTLSAVDAGFITLFAPSVAQMAALASYMWSGSFDLTTWKKIFADPMDAILGLSIVPVSVPTSTTKTVQVGNISTGVSMSVASSQYVEVDCGTLNVQEYWGAYLDYEPYTKAEIYLPYIGTHPVSVDDIMGKSVHVVYHVDILSGACVAYVKCGSSVLYNFVGQCSSSIPITGDNWTNVVNGALSIAGSIGSMVATGGATAPMAALDIASTAVNTMKPTIEKSGAVSGTGGLLGIQTPYLILTRPRQATPANQNSFTGYPVFVTAYLRNMTGYTEVASIHLEGIPATESELSEIEQLLKSGVIF